MTRSIERAPHDEASKIAEALEILERFLLPDQVRSSLFSLEDLRPLERLHQDSSYYNASLPRLVLVGEFKAGKSTLMNALLGGDYAATDILEMTSWIARYWPSPLPFCRITFNGGRERVLPPDVFREKCETRSFTADELASVDRIDVGLPLPTMKFSIIDCPGFGSVTVDNEKRLLRAIDDADLLVWVISIDSIGSIREGVLLRKLLSQGMPRIVVLTKCDLLDGPEELEEIRDYLTEHFQTSSDVVFPTSAQEALYQETASSSQSGIPVLAEHLRHGIVPRFATMRKAAEKAHYRRTADVAINLLQRAERELVRIDEAVSRFQIIAGRIRCLVQNQVETELEAWTKDSMFSPNRDTLAHDLEAELKQAGGSLSSDIVSDVFRRNLGDRYIDSFWQDVTDKVSYSAIEFWANRLKEVAAELDDVCRSFQSSAWGDIPPHISPFAIQEAVNAVATEAFTTGMKTSLGIAGVATAYLAWLGPSAGYITTGMALTGVGIPIAAIGAGVSAVLWYRKRKGTEAVLADRAEDAINTYINRFVTEILRPHIFPRIDELNRTIEAEMVGGFQRNLFGSVPCDDLQDLLSQIRLCSQSLRGLL